MKLSLSRGDLLWVVGMSGTERGKLSNSSLNSFPEDSKHKTCVPACCPFKKELYVQRAATWASLYVTLKQYVTILKFKLEHFHCGVEQEAGHLLILSKRSLLETEIPSVLTLILKIIVHHVETVGLRSHGLWVTGAWFTEKTDTVPGCVRPFPLLICTRVLLLRRGEGQLWLLYYVCCGRGGVLWGARTWTLRSRDDLWISHLWARHVRLRLPWASVRQRWENLSQYLSTESWEQTGEDERHTCCHFHPERPVWDRWGEFFLCVFITPDLTEVIMTV